MEKKGTLPTLTESRGLLNICSNASILCCVGNARSRRGTCHFSAADYSEVLSLMNCSVCSSLYARASAASVTPILSTLREGQKYTKEPFGIDGISTALGHKEIEGLPIPQAASRKHPFSQNIVQNSRVQYRLQDD